MQFRLYRAATLAALILLLIVYGSGISHAQTEQRTLQLRLGGSELVHTDYPFMRVSIADPEVADVVVLYPQELYVYGKKVGYTSLILWSDNGEKTLIDAVVALDLTGMKERLAHLYPMENISVHSSAKGIVLSGTVSSPETVEQVLRLAQNYLPKEAEGGKATEGTGRSGAGVTNLLRVSGPQQVLLEVKVAEVTRNWNREFRAGIGIDGLSDSFTGNIGTTPVPVTELNPGSLLLNFAGNAANVFLNIDDFRTSLRFLETNGLARTLAEPRLVTTSGQEASFLAGGEFPIPVPQGLDQITIEFKEFGVALRFLPVVLADGRISLRVAPSVSEISSTSVIPAGMQGANFIVPNLSTRRLETTVEMYDGQTLALAGLLQDNLREAVDKVPGLGDIPILGALFRSSTYRQQKTDLLIAITPRIVRPVPAGSIKYPGEHMKPPNRWEFYLEGRLEGRRPFDQISAFGAKEYLRPRVSPLKSGGLEGDFGFQSVE
jgi:pilus assembly protein CpaC